MLSQEDNEILTRVGPGTPMGNMFRQYWIPAIRADELPAPDCPPLRVKLLGEELIGFRTTSGAVGLIQNACPHRGASLFFGRNEEEGLRCVYHGWKFDVTGACVDMPSEPAESNFKNKVRAKAYPTQRAQRHHLGLHGAARGAAAAAGARGQHDRRDYTISVLHRPNNWMQGIEGEMDTIHAAFLHCGAEPPAHGRAGHLRATTTAKPLHGKFSVRDTDYGTSYGMYRAAEEDTYYWRIGHLLFPFFAMPPGASVLGEDPRFIAYVPMDDYNTLEWRSVGAQPRWPQVRRRTSSLGRRSTCRTARAGSSASASSRTWRTTS